MKSYLRKLKAYIKANPSRFDDDCPLPALDSLYWHYTECHTMTNERTKQASRNLNAVFNLCCRLCSAYERKAFRDGILYGAHLISEIKGECISP